jgi:hypothetical protein
MRRTVLTASLLTASMLAAGTSSWGMEKAPAAPPVKPTFVTGEQSIAIDTGDLKQVAKARFYLSRDEGQTWTLAQETVVDAAAPKAPVFAFKPQGDGSYYIVTATVYRDGRSEAEPAPKSIPGKALLLVVDTTPPVISTLEATAQPITDPAATSAVIDVTWAITEAHFASATLDVSLDGGASFTPNQTIAASGTAHLTLDRPKDNTVQLRITAKDAAGNQAASLAKVITLPLPPDPEKALATAVSKLPTLADVQPPPDVPAVAATTAASATTPAPTGAGTAPAATTTATPDVTPAAAPAPVASGPVASSTTDRAVLPPSGTTFLTGEKAESALDEARKLAEAKDVDGAHTLYLRLQDSAVAKQAVAEDLALLRTAGDAAAVVGVAEALRTELHTDPVRLEQGKAQLAMGRPVEAEQVLRTVRKDSDEAREALLYIGKAAFAQGKIAISTKIYEKLAAGDDAIAVEAKLLRGK